MVRRVVISGCSGGGKSTLIDALAAKGYSTFPEPGRLVVEAELAAGGQGLPWEDAARFATLVIARGIAQWEAAQPGLNFYDRSLIDAVTWHEGQPGPVPDHVAALADKYRYDTTVFLTPPWPEIYVQDDARKHGLTDAIREYDALCDSYPAKGYGVEIVPKLGVEARAAWVLQRTQG